MNNHEFVLYYNNFIIQNKKQFMYIYINKKNQYKKIFNFNYELIYLYLNN